MKKLIAAAAMMAVAFPVLAWEGMNRQIDQTNFIIGKGDGHCSGTLISVEERLVVTAYHCIDGMVRVVTEDKPEGDSSAEGGPVLLDEVRKVRVRKTDPVPIFQKQYDGFTHVGSTVYITRIVADDRKNDIAVLQLLGDNLLSTEAAPLLPRGGKVTRGEMVYAVGNPRMQDASITKGMVSNVTRRVSLYHIENAPMFQFSANIQPGSSGGALYNDRGEYIGTTVAAWPGSDLGLAVPVYTLRALLDRAGLMQSAKVVSR